MNKSEVNVLIVDDDESTRKAICEAIKRGGYNAIEAERPAAAESICKIKPVHAAIVDCMLPGKNGVDLALAMKSQMTDEAPIFLMSGIFKDPSYSQEALAKVGAKEFFAKPVDLEKLLLQLEEALMSLVSAPKVDMHALLASPFSDNRERRKAIELVESMSGYDIPFMCCILMDAGSSGHLNLVTDQQEIYGLSFVKGELAKVDSETTKTTLKNLIVNKGFVTEEEVNEVSSRLKGNLVKNLINESYLSPNIMDQIGVEQMIFDLENIISPKNMQVNFVPDRHLQLEGPRIDEQKFNHFVHDVIDKIPLSWFQGFYSIWQGHPILRGPQLKENHQVIKMPILENAKGIVEELAKSPTYSEAFHSLGMDEIGFYKALHLLMIKRLFVFDENRRASNIEDHIARIKQTYEALKGKTPPEIFAYFGAAPDARPDECAKLYKEFVKTNHPDKLPQTSDQNIRQINHELFSLVTDASDVMSNSEKREGYYNKVKQETVEKQLKSEDISHKATILLQRGKASEALQFIDQAKEHFESSTTTLLELWAKMKIKPNLTQAELDQYEKILREIPLSQRKNPVYPFVNGLRKKAAMDLDGAKREFQKALQIDTQFMDARREIAGLKNAKKKDTKDILTSDLSNIVGSLFKRKK